MRAGAAVHGCVGEGLVQRQVVAQAPRQVGRSDHGTAKRHHVGAAAAQGLDGHFLGVAVVDHPDARIQAAQGLVVERGVVARAAGVAFDDVDVHRVELFQLAHHMLEQRLRVALRRVVDGRDGREADAHAVGADLLRHSGHHFEQEAGAVFDAAAVRVGAVVGAVAQEGVDQVAMGAVDFHAVKTGGNGIGGGLTEVVHHTGDFGGFQRARYGAVHVALADDVGLGLGGDGRGGHGRLLVGLEGVVRHAAGVPELHEDLAALGVHGVGHLLPGGDLCGRVDAGGIGVALGGGRDLRGLGNDQAHASALAVVLDHHVGGFQRIVGAAAREWRHGHAVGDFDAAQLEGLEQGVGGEGFCGDTHGGLLLGGGGNARRGCDGLEQVVKHQSHAVAQRCRGFFELHAQQGTFPGVPGQG